MRIIKTAIFTILIITGPMLSSAFCKPLMAFGYLTNNSDDQNYNYLETIFPNSFASSIRNTFDVDVIKPHVINKKLEKYDISLKKIYYPYELQELIKKIKSDMFIYGSFIPLPNDRIKIVLNLYTKNSNVLFTFTNIGKMETEIFKLVDRITQILINYMDKEKIYRNKIIKSGSRLAILTNLEGHKLNLLYVSFLNNGYSITGVQGNYLTNIISKEMIDKFMYIQSRDNSYSYITDYRKIKFLHGTWAGEKHYKKIKKLREILKTYDFDYISTKNNFIDKLNKEYNNKIDDLIIIGFNKKETRAWVRSIDLKNKDLIWMQSNIRGSGILEITSGIIERMSKPIKLSIKNEK